MVDSQGAGVQRVVTDMRVLEESVLESSVVAADIRHSHSQVLSQLSEVHSLSIS